MVKLYLDTSVIIAMAYREDGFHDKSLKFMREVRKLEVEIMIGNPILLELGKAVQRKGIETALTILRTIEHHKIKLAMLDPDRLSSLVDRYLSENIVGEKYRFDLLHYASATLLNCTHLVSWDKGHFNQSVGKKVNAVNSVLGLATLNVGDPVDISRSLKLD